MALLNRNKIYSNIYALLSKLNATHMKQDILASYDATSLRELSDDQLDHLVMQLQKQFKTIKPSDKTDTEVRKWRSNVLVILTDMGIYENQTSWHRVNSYLRDPRIAGKEMYLMNVPELKALCVKLRAISKKRQNQIDIENHWAQNN